MSSRGIGVTPAGAVAIAAAIVAYQLAGPSGSKWLTTLAVLVGLATFADGVVAFALMRRVELVVTPPSISQVGIANDVEVRVVLPRAQVSIRSLADTTTRPVVVDGDRRRVALRSVPPVRGVFRVATFEVRCDDPFGLVVVTRQVRVVMTAPAYVAPALGTPAPPGTDGIAASTADPAHARPTPDGTDLVAVRPFQHGDPLRRVHWRSSERTGLLHVRLGEPPVDDVVRLVVDLGPEPGPECERRASDAMATGSELIGDGRRLVVVTRETGGVVTDVVRNRRDLGRRLAAAVPGVPP
jgi:uncharacterized protein (DUF58 family)